MTMSTEEGRGRKGGRDERGEREGIHNSIYKHTIGIRCVYTNEHNYSCALSITLHCYMRREDIKETIILNFFHPY